jgi:hypothetical protein
MTTTALVTLLAAGTAGRPLLTPGFIQSHNSAASSWTAGETPISSMSTEEFSRMMGSVPIASASTSSLTEPWPLQAVYEELKLKNTTYPDWFGAQTPALKARTQPSRSPAPHSTVTLGLLCSQIPGTAGAGAPRSRRSATRVSADLAGRTA